MLSWLRNEAVLTWRAPGFGQTFPFAPAWRLRLESLPRRRSCGLGPSMDTTPYKPSQIAHLRSIERYNSVAMDHCPSRHAILDSRGEFEEQEEIGCPHTGQRFYQLHPPVRHWHPDRVNSWASQTSFLPSRSQNTRHRYHFLRQQCPLRYWLAHCCLGCICAQSDTRSDRFARTIATIHKARHRDPHVPHHHA